MRTVLQKMILIQSKNSTLQKLDFYSFLAISSMYYNLIRVGHDY